MFVSIVKLDLYFPFAHSLKEKRHCLQKIKSRLLSQHSILAAEVGFQDKWQRAQLGFALVNADSRHLESVVDKVISFVESLGLGEILDCQREMIHF